MLLAGDLGGTKTLLGLFEPSAPRPRPIATRTFSTLEYDDLPSMIAAFAKDHTSSTALSIDRACFGVAGLITGDTAELTNVGWLVDARDVATRFDIRRVALLNDLQAMAYAVPVLEPAELIVLQEGRRPKNGNRALIAAGTGLGEALLHYVDGRLIPSPSEGGHADFAARNDREIDLLRDLTSRFGRAEVEQVVSGRGIVNIHRFVHSTQPCTALTDDSEPDRAAAISKAALERRCPACIETLNLFVDAYGAEAGNLALRSVSTGGLYVGGGIAPKILPALTDGRFLRAFRDKAPFIEMLDAIPLHVILNQECGLLGAAVHAAEL